MTFVGIPFLWHVRDVPAWIFLGIWFLGQFLLPTGSGVAWMAHVGGFLAGLGAVRLLARTRPRAADGRRGRIPAAGPSRGARRDGGNALDTDEPAAQDRGHPKFRRLSSAG